MKLFKCDCLLFRKLSLLGFAHPVEGISFQAQVAFEKTAHFRGRF